MLGSHLRGALRGSAAVGRTYILRDDLSVLTHIEQMQACERAEVEGLGAAFARALMDADHYGLTSVDLGALPEWAQQQLREWYGERVA